MVKFHFIRTARSTRASRALIAAGPPHPDHMTKRLHPETHQGKVVYGPAAGTPPMRRPQPELANVTHWVSLPFG